jgi:hypothetical protein
MVLGAFTQVMPGRSNRVLGLDDVGGFGNTPDDDYNDVSLEIVGNNDVAFTIMRSEIPGRSAPSTWTNSSGQSGTAGGTALSGANYYLINNNSSNYKG